MPAQPPRWDDARLDADRERSIREFRAERLAEPLDAYREHYERCRGAVERLLAATNDLADLAGQAASVLADTDLLYAARYLASPPISADDLTMLTGSPLSPAAMGATPKPPAGSRRRSCCCSTASASRGCPRADVRRTRSGAPPSSRPSR